MFAKARSDEEARDLILHRRLTTEFQICIVDLIPNLEGVAQARKTVYGGVTGDMKPAVRWPKQVNDNDRQPYCASASLETSGQIIGYVWHKPPWTLITDTHSCVSSRSSVRGVRVCPLRFCIRQFRIERSLPRGDDLNRCRTSVPAQS